MRRVSARGTLLFLISLVFLVTPALYADQLPPGMEPPEVRIKPPGGIASNEQPMLLAELFWMWVQVRIAPPMG
jgi:hypothetical protein